MQDDVGAGLPEGLGQPGVIGQIPLDKPGAFIHRRGMSLGQVVVSGHVVSGVSQFFDARRADVTRAAGDEDAHKN